MKEKLQAITSHSYLTLKKLLKRDLFSDIFQITLHKHKTLANLTTRSVCSGEKLTIFPSKAGNVKSGKSEAAGALNLRRQSGGKRPPRHCPGQWRWQTPGPGWRRKSPPRTLAWARSILLPGLLGNRHGRQARHPPRRALALSSAPPSPAVFVISTLGSQRSAAERTGHAVIPHEAHPSTA